MRAPTLFLILLAAPCVTRADETTTLADAVRRGVSYVEQEGVAWIKKRNCVSCHQIPAMLWTLGEAHQRGFYNHPKKLADWTEWSLQWQYWNTPKDDQTEDTVAADNIDTMTSLILSYPPSLPDKAKRQFARYVDHIVHFQQKDGSWKPGGQLPLQKRSKEESGQVTTMWTILALEASGLDSDAIQEGRRRAVQYVADLPPGKSTEWWLTRWLVECTIDSKKAEGLLTQLLKFQHDDGGWGWLCADPSDAFGTGLALYGLTRSGLRNDHAAIQRARAYLLRTQNKDGSWPTPSTLARHRARVLPTSQHWATAWATRALMSTMDSRVK
jgi:squalene-hopene/tetraprenyl-beta-curcumene cyclase